MRHLIFTAALLTGCQFNPAGLSAHDGGMDSVDAGTSADALATEHDALWASDSMDPVTDAMPATDAADPIPDAELPLLWDGIYQLDYVATPAQCWTYDRMRLAVDTFNNANFWFSNDATTGYGTSAAIIDSDTVHVDDVLIIDSSIVMQAWDLTRETDGVLTGTLTTNTGCTFEVTAVRL